VASVEVAPTEQNQASESKREKKKFVRQIASDRSQRFRRAAQALFFALNVWIGAQFYSFVRYYEAGASGTPVSRPSGVDGWLPIAGLMNLKLFIVTGRLPIAHPAGMFLFIAFAAISLVFRKAFCSWLCPVGTLSEYLWRLGRLLFRRNFRIPQFLDVPLRALKYLLLAFFMWAVVGMSAAAIEEFMQGPFGLLADVKMLNFFRDLSLTAATIIGLLAIASVFVQNFWCRYLCPYGALMGLLSMLSPLRIRRSESACIDCTLCAKACPSALPVDQLVQIKSAECIGCTECVAICPAEGALQMSLGRRAVPAWVVAAGVAAVFLGVVAGAKVSGHWDTHLPATIYERLIPQANMFEH
jgi:polyferredoxin